MEITYHAYVFIIGLSLLVSLASSVVAVSIRNLLVDVSWYNEVLEKSTENVRIVGLNETGLVKYAIANPSPRVVELRSGYALTQTGQRISIAYPAYLNPGSVYVGNATLPHNTIALVVESASGRSYFGKIYSIQSDTYSFSITNVLPALYTYPIGWRRQNPLGGEDVSVSWLTIATRARIFGYVYAKSAAGSSTHAFIYYRNIDELYLSCQSNCRTLYTETVQSPSTNPSIRATLALYFNYTYYALSMNLSVSRSAVGASGLYVKACFGFSWQVMSNVLFSYEERTRLPTVSHVTSNSMLVDKLILTFVPVSGSILGYTISSIQPLDPRIELDTSSSPPLMTVGELILARCIAIYTTSNSIQTTGQPIPTYTLGNTTAYFHLRFGASTPIGSEYASTDSIPLDIKVETDVLLRYLVGF